MGRLEIVNGGQGSHGGLAQEQDASLPHTQQKRQVSSGIFEYKEKGHKVKMVNILKYVLFLGKSRGF